MDCILAHLKDWIDLPVIINDLQQAERGLVSAGLVPHHVDFLKTWGAPTMISHLNWATSYLAPWNYNHSHSINLLFASEAGSLDIEIVTGELEYTDRAIRLFNWSTFRFDENGWVLLSFDDPDYHNQCWSTAGGVDLDPYFLNGMAFLPKIAPTSTDYSINYSSII